MEVNIMDGCCGAYEIYDFDDINQYFDYSEEYSRKKARKAAKEALEDAISEVSGGKLIVITLIDQQLRNGWLSIVKELGFRRVARWINSNVGNVCNMFVRENGCRPAPKYKGRNK